MRKRKRWSYVSLGLSILLAASQLQAEDTNETFKNPAAYAHYQKGAAYLKEGLIDKAVKELLAAAELAPAEYLPYNDLAYAYFYSGKLDEALDLFRKALMLKADYSPTLRGIASVYMALGQETEAAIYFEKAIALDPSVTASYAALGIIYNHKKRYQDAIPLFQKALEASPRLDAAYFGLGYDYYMLGDIEKAIDHYLKGIVLNPYSAEVFEKLADCFMKTEKFRAAYRYAKETLKIEPRNQAMSGLTRSLREKFKSDLKERRIKINQAGAASAA